MSKNIVRKTLAFGSGLAILASAFVAAPAQAAATLTIAPDAGTSYKVFSGDDFALKAFGNIDLTIDANTNLWWAVTQTAAQTVTVYDQAGWGAAAKTTALAANAASTTTVKYYDALAAAGAGASKFYIDPTGNSTFTTTTVGVQAFIELDGTPGLTAGDLASNSVTVEFLGAADIAKLSPTVSASTVTAASTSSILTVTVPGINYHQANQKGNGLAAANNAMVNSESLRVVSTLNGTDTAQTGLAVNAAKTAFVKTVSFAASATNVFAGTLQAIRFEGDTVRSTLAVTGANVATDDDVNSLTLINTVGANLRVAAAGDYTGSAVTTWAVRKGSTFTVVASAIDTNDQNEPQAGAKITVKVEENAVDGVTAGTVISAGGQSFTAAANSAADSLSYTAVADAKGLISITVTSSTGAAGNPVKVTVTAADGATTDNDVYGWVTPKASALAVTSAPASGVVEVVRGSIVSATVAVLDDFKENWVDAANSYRITTTLTGTDTTGVAAKAYAGSPVTISWTDGSAAGGALTASFAFQVLASGAWGATTPATTGASQVYEVVTAAQAPSLVTAITANATGGAAADLVATAVALNLEDYADETITTSGTTSKFLHGVVYAANGALAKGVLVTIASPGVGFKVGSTYSEGSITLRTTAAGVYEAEVFSNQSGTKTFTVTSGTASKTAKIKFDAPLTTAGKSLTIDAPSYVEAGSTLKIGISIKDLYGNGINTDGVNTVAAGGDFSYSYSGPGLLVGSAPTETDATGSATASYLFGSKDSGTITVTVKYDKNGDADYADYGDLVTTKTITIGTAPAAAKVNVGSFNGKLVVYANGYNGKKISWKVGGKWGSAVAASDTARFARVTPVKGVTVTVLVYVDGKLELTKPVVTK